RPRRSKQPSGGLCARWAPALLRASVVLHPGFFYDGRPALRLLADEGGKFRRRAGRREQAGGVRLRLANTRNAPLWISESDADGPSKEKSTLLVSTPWATSALPL